MHVSTRSVRVVTAILVLLITPVAIAEEPADGVSLDVTDGPGDFELTLSWTGGKPSFDVYRSSMASDVTDPGNLLGATDDRTWSDQPPVGDLFFYRVTSPCITEPGVECASEAVDPAVVAQGSYPDLAVDSNGDVHIIYARSGSLYYKKWDAGDGTWGAEDATGLSDGQVERSDPEIVIDSQDRPHIMGGSSYAYWNGSGWTSINPGVTRDTAMAIDGNDNVYIVRRGGHNGGYLGLRVRYAGASSFSALPDPDIANGLPLGRNDHVYGHVFINPVDDSVHIMYRHGAPSWFAYRASTDGGQNWFGGGVSGDDHEAPSGAASLAGMIYGVGGAGTVYRRSGTPSSWTNLGRGVSSGGRDLPALSVDPDENIYVTSFQGRMNVRNGSGWVGETTLPALSGNPLGFAETAPGPGNFVYVVWEEGTSVNNDNPAGTSDILFATIDSNGVVGSN